MLVTEVSSSRGGTKEVGRLWGGNGRSVLWRAAAEGGMSLATEDLELVAQEVLREGVQ